MTVYLFSNNAETTLAAPLSDVATSCTLAAGTGDEFPSPGAGEAFTVTFVDAATGIQTEIALCTARTGDTLTLVRGQEGTTAQAWIVGDFAGNYDTAGTMQHLVQQDQFQVGKYEQANTVAGSANAITATLPSELVALVDGLAVRVRAGAANTAAATLRLTLGVTDTTVLPIVKYGNQALTAGDIPGAGYVMLLNYSAAYTSWILQNPSLTNQNSAGSISAVNYAVAGGSANAITGAFTPAVTSLTDGLKLRVKAGAVNTGAVTFKADGTTLHSVVNQGLGALIGGEIAVGTELEFTYDLTNTRWIMTAPAVVARTFKGNFNTGGGTTTVSLTGGPYSTIRASWAGVKAAADYQMFGRINADAGNNYGWAANDVNGSGSGASHGAASVSGICLQLNSSLNDDSAVTPNAFNGSMTILNAQSAADYKSGTFSTGMVRVVSGGLNGIIGGTFEWLNAAAAVSSISFIMGSATGTSPSGTGVAATGGTYTIECIP